MTKQHTQPSETYLRELLSLRPFLQGMARKLTQNTDRAADLVQDIMLKAIQYHDKFTPGTNMKAWLTTILKNTHRTQMRRVGKLITMPADEIFIPYPENQHTRVEVKDCIKNIRCLSPRQRKIITAAVLGNNYEEVAKIIGVPVGTVKSALSRARARLKELQMGRDQVDAPVIDAQHVNYARRKTLAPAI